MYKIKKTRRFLSDITVYNILHDVCSSVAAFWGDTGDSAYNGSIPRICPRCVRTRGYECFCKYIRGRCKYAFFFFFYLILNCQASVTKSYGFNIISRETINEFDTKDARCQVCFANSQYFAIKACVVC